MNAQVTMINYLPSFFSENCGQKSGQMKRRNLLDIVTGCKLTPAIRTWMSARAKFSALFLRESFRAVLLMLGVDTFFTY